MTTALPNTMTYPQQLDKIKNNMSVLSQSQPDVMKGFSVLHVAGVSPGALDSKTKE